MSISEADQTAKKSLQRRQGLMAIGAVVALAALIYFFYWVFYARHFESTNDAYVGGNIVAISAREEGTVLSIRADNTEHVDRGQLLIELDPAAANINMEAARADLARTVRNVHALIAKADALRAQVAASEVQYQRAQSDYKRRAALQGDGAVSAEEVAHARDTLAEINATREGYRSDLRGTLVQLGNTDINKNPDVLAAEARMRNAALSVGHMKIVAPVAGVVAQRSVQLGQHVQAGTPLMAVVPLESVWVDANFKEGQLVDMRVGQPVTIEADIYGGSVTYHGHVVGLGAGSGSAFSLLPAQNASGNWIKIVQRVPVRVALDPAEVKEHPLRVGLSVDVSVDVRELSGEEIAKQTPPAHTQVADQGDNDWVEAEIAKVIADNSGDLLSAGRTK